MSIKVALICGSTREGRFCDRVAGWAAGELWGRSEFSVDVIDPEELDLPARHLRGVTAEVASLRERIGNAEAFLVVTPEYNHSYPAALKFLIDSVGEQWYAKPVAFISYGGNSGGARAVEHLRAVFAELHAVTLRDTVSFADAWTQFDDRGVLRHPAGANRALDVLLERLQWWATALTRARIATPYVRTVAAAERLAS